jgi:hypothetical protein
VKKLAAWIIALALIAAVFIAGCGQTRPQATVGPPAVDIWTAVVEGNVGAVQQHASAGIDLNAREPANGSTPLIVAAVFGQTEAARVLVESGAEVDATNNDGSTALLTAAFFCHPETVELLLESGADVNVANNAGRTPLDTVSAAWSPDLEAKYTFFAEAFQIQLDLERIQSTRPVVADMLRTHGGKPASAL